MKILQLKNKTNFFTNDNQPYMRTKNKIERHKTSSHFAVVVYVQGVLVVFFLTYYKTDLGTWGFRVKNVKTQGSGKNCPCPYITTYLGLNVTNIHFFRLHINENFCNSAIY